MNAKINALKKKCLRGHPLTGANLYVYKATGRRKCKKCQKDQIAKWRETYADKLI